MFERLSSVILVTFLLLVSGGECQYGGAPPSDNSNLPSGPTPVTPPASSPPAPPAPPAPAPPPPAPAPPAPATPPADSPPATPPADAPPVENCNATGMWYAVMSTAVSDSGPCNLFTNNKPPCQCIAAYYQPLQPNSWQVYINTINNQSQELTVDMGGASSDDQKDFKSFTVSRAVMPLTTVSAMKYTITDKVSGAANFIKYDMTVIGYSEENSYMITTIKETEGGNPTPMTVIWCRKKFPGRNTIWRAIVVNLKALGINDHDLQFIKQDGCTYPSLQQYGNMYFCAQ